LKSIVKDKLFEDPDQSNARGYPPLDWSVDTAHPFGVNMMRGEVNVGPPGQTHEIINSIGWDEYGDYEGRIWPREKVISFWEAPRKTLLLHIWKELIIDPKLRKYNLKDEDIHDFLFDIPNPDQSADNEDAIYTYKDYPNNPKIQIRSMKRPEHTVSPLLKKKENQPKVSGGGSYKYAKEKPLAYRQAMQTSESVVRLSINESPDTVCSTSTLKPNAEGKYIDSWTCAPDTSKMAEYCNYDARAFGIVDVQKYLDEPVHDYGKMWVSERTYWHRYGGRENFKYAGRIWLEKGIISFWEYPPPEKMNEVIELLAKKLKDVGEFERNKISTIKKKLGEFLIEIIDSGEGDDKTRNVWRKDGKWQDYSDNPIEKFKTKFIKINQYSNLTNIQQMNPEDTIGDHTVSPMNKGKRSVPHGFGSKHPESEKRAEERRNKSFESVINENPDNIHHNNYDISFNTSGAFPFGFYHNRALIGVENSTHGSLSALLNDEEKEEIGWRGMRRVLKYSGRFWERHRIISFWEYPETKEKLKEVIEKLQEQAWKNGIVFLPFDEDWKIEIVVEKNEDGFKTYDIIPLWDFIGSEDRSEEELDQEHIISPMLKKKKSVPYGVGSKAPQSRKKPLTWKQAMYAENYNSLNENPNVIFIRDTGGYKEWNRKNCISFSRYSVADIENELVTSEGSTHDEMGREWMYSMEKKFKPDNIEEFYENYPRYGRGPESGRIFIKEKVLTFWIYPETKQAFLTLIKELNEKYRDLNLLSDPEWVVEIPPEGTTEPDTSGWGSWVPDADDQEFVPFSEYSGGYIRTKKEVEKEHILSPMEKNKKKVPYGVGSKAPQSRKKPLPWKQAMYAESYDPLNENPNAVFKPSVWKRKKEQGKESYTATGSEVIEFNKGSSVPFLYYDDDSKIAIGSTSNTHTDLLRKLKREGLVSGPSKERSAKSGRLFPEIKVLSFWNFPKDYNELVEVIKDLEHKTGHNILNDPKYLLEIPAADDKGAIDNNPGSWGSWFPRVYAIDFIPFSEFKGGQKRSKEELAQQHVISPLEKKKRSVPYGVGSNSSKRKPLPWKQAMYAESYDPLTESPDWFFHRDTGENVQWFHKEYIPITFAWYKGKFYWGGIDKQGYIQTHDRLETGGVARADLTYPGRLWKKLKVISFWEHPENNEEMIKALKIISKDIGIDILGDPKWRIEIKKGKNWEFVSVKDYTGSSELSNKEKAQQHIMSPMQKPKSSLGRKLPPKPPKPLAWKQAMHAESYYPRLK